MRCLVTAGPTYEPLDDVRQGIEHILDTLIRRQQSEGE